MNHYPCDLFSFTLTPFDLERVFKGLQNIANALDFLHSRGLAHRDIKPENIVVDKDYFRLIDFDFTSPLIDFVKCGTKNYMYPATCSDWTPRDRSIRYDIYAFGRTILYVFYCAASLKVFYCTASNKMIERQKLMEKLFSNNSILKNVENPFRGDAGRWFDVALKCCSEVPHLVTVPTTDDTVTTL